MVVPLTLIYNTYKLAIMDVRWVFFDCNIVTLLTVYNSVTVVQIEGMNYGSD